MICERLHDIFNGLKRHQFPFDGRLIPKNGIYILFEKGERAHIDCDRIVRIGTHTGQDNLPKRLAEHFLIENKDRSIFRKNIGRALLNQKQDAFIKQWEIDLTTKAAKRRQAGQINLERLSQLEKKVSSVIKDLFTFCVFPIEDKQKRLHFEERMIATANHCAICGPSNAWLGNHSPKNKIRESGLWLVQGLNGREMTHGDLEMLETTIRQVNKLLHRIGRKRRLLLGEVSDGQAACQRTE